LDGPKRDSDEEFDNLPPGVYVERTCSTEKDKDRDARDLFLSFPAKLAWRAIKSQLAALPGLEQCYEIDKQDKARRYAVAKFCNITAADAARTVLQGKNERGFKGVIVRSSSFSSETRKRRTGEEQNSARSRVRARHGYRSLSPKSRVISDEGSSTPSPTMHRKSVQKIENTPSAALEQLKLQCGNRDDDTTRKDSEKDEEPNVDTLSTRPKTNDTLDRQATKTTNSKPVILNTPERQARLELELELELRQSQRQMEREPLQNKDHADQLAENLQSAVVFTGPQQALQQSDGVPGSYPMQDKHRPHLQASQDYFHHYPSPAPLPTHHHPHPYYLYPPPHQQYTWSQPPSPQTYMGGYVPPQGQGAPPSLPPQQQLHQQQLQHHQRSNSHSHLHAQAPSHRPHHNIHHHRHHPQHQMHPNVEPELQTKQFSSRGNEGGGKSEAHQFASQQPSSPNVPYAPNFPEQARVPYPPISHPSNSFSSTASSPFQGSMKSGGKLAPASPISDSAPLEVSRLYVAFPRPVREEALRQAFHDAAPGLEYVSRPREKCFVFVKYSSEAAAKLALLRLNGKEIEGCTLKVSVAQPPPAGGSRKRQRPQDATVEASKK